MMREEITQNSHIHILHPGMLFLVFQRLQFYILYLLRWMEKSYHHLFPVIQRITLSICFRLWIRYIKDNTFFWLYRSEPFENMANATKAVKTCVENQKIASMILVRDFCIGHFEMKVIPLNTG